MVGINETRERQSHRQPMDRALSLDFVMSNSGFMHDEILLDQRLGPLDLFVVSFFRYFISTTPSQAPSQAVRIEMLDLLRESRGMVRAHQPGRHPILFSRQVGHSSVNVVPLELVSPAFPEYLLDVRINLAQIVERCGGLDGLR
jgi:hypothetical protein